MPVPSITEILSTTTPIITVVINWIEPFWALLVGVSIAFIAGAAIISWLVGGMGYLVRRDKDI